MAKSVKFVGAGEFVALINDQQVPFKTGDTLTVPDDVAADFLSRIEGPPEKRAPVWVDVTATAAPASKTPAPAAPGTSN